MSTVHINFSGIDKFAQLMAAGSEHMRRAFRQMARIYRGAMQERFDRLSKSGGGGEWPPLAESTIKARMRAPITRLNRALREGHITEEQHETRIKAARQKVLGRDLAFLRAGGYGGYVTSGWRGNRSNANVQNFPLLKVTGTLFRVLSPKFSNQPGAVEQDLPNGIRVGFGGPARHPSGKATIADIAAFHHFGAGHLPARTLLAQPDENTRALMRQALETATERAAKESNIL